MQNESMSLRAKSRQRLAVLGSAALLGGLSLGLFSPLSRHSSRHSSRETEQPVKTSLGCGKSCTLNLVQKDDFAVQKAAQVLKKLSSLESFATGKSVIAALMVQGDLDCDKTQDTCYENGSKQGKEKFSEEQLEENFTNVAKSLRTKLADEANFQSCNDSSSPMTNEENKKDVIILGLLNFGLDLTSKIRQKLFNSDNGDHAVGSTMRYCFQSCEQLGCGLELGDTKLCLLDGLRGCKAALVDAKHKGLVSEQYLDFFNIVWSLLSRLEKSIGSLKVINSAGGDVEDAKDFCLIRLADAYWIAADLDIPNKSDLKCTQNDLSRIDELVAETASTAQNKPFVRGGRCRAPVRSKSLSLPQGAGSNFQRSGKVGESLSSCKGRSASSVECKDLLSNKTTVTERSTTTKNEQVEQPKESIQNTTTAKELKGIIKFGNPNKEDIEFVINEYKKPDETAVFFQSFGYQRRTKKSPVRVISYHTDLPVYDRVVGSKNEFKYRESKEITKLKELKRKFLKESLQSRGEAVDPQDAGGADVTTASLVRFDEENIAATTSKKEGSMPEEGNDKIALYRRQAANEGKPLMTDSSNNPPDMDDIIMVEESAGRDNADCDSLDVIDGFSESHCNSRTLASTDGIDTDEEIGENDTKDDENLDMTDGISRWSNFPIKPPENPAIVNCRTKTNRPVCRSVTSFRRNRDNDSLRREREVRSRGNFGSDNVSLPNSTSFRNAFKHKAGHSDGDNIITGEADRMKPTKKEGPRIAKFFSPTRTSSDTDSFAGVRNSTVASKIVTSLKKKRGSAKPVDHPKPSTRSRKSEAEANSTGNYLPNPSSHRSRMSTCLYPNYSRGLSPSLNAATPYGIFQGNFSPFPSKEFRERDLKGRQGKGGNSVTENDRKERLRFLGPICSSGSKMPDNLCSYGLLPDGSVKGARGTQNHFNENSGRSSYHKMQHFNLDGDPKVVQISRGQNTPKGGKFFESSSKSDATPHRPAGDKVPNLFKTLDHFNPPKQHQHSKQCSDSNHEHIKMADSKREPMTNATSTRNDESQKQVESQERKTYWKSTETVSIGTSRRVSQYSRNSDQPDQLSNEYHKRSNCLPLIRFPNNSSAPGSKLPEVGRSQTGYSNAAPPPLVCSTDFQLPTHTPEQHHDGRISTITLTQLNRPNLGSHRFTQYQQYSGHDTDKNSSFKPKPNSGRVSPSVQDSELSSVQLLKMNIDQTPTSSQNNHKFYPMQRRVAPSSISTPSKSSRNPDFGMLYPPLCHANQQNSKSSEELPTLMSVIGTLV